MAISQIAFHFVFTVLFVIANVVFVRAILYRLRLIFSARKAAGTENFLENPNWFFRINSFIQNVILQKKNFKEPLRGIMHAFIFYGFVVYTIHTTSQMIAGLIGYGMDDPYKFSLIGFLFGESAGHTYESIVQVVSILVLIGLGFLLGEDGFKRQKGWMFILQHPRS